MTSQPGATITAPGNFQRSTESMKKRIDIHGTLELPLAIGCAIMYGENLGIKKALEILVNE